MSALYPDYSGEDGTAYTSDEFTEWYGAGDFDPYVDDPPEAGNEDAEGEWVDSQIDYLIHDQGYEPPF